MKRIIPAVFVFFFALMATASAVEFSADMTTEVAGMKSPGKIYFKDAKTSRTEMTGMMNMVIITKHPMSYQLFPNTKRYVVIDLEKLKAQNPMADVDNFDKWLEKNNFSKTGAETIQGYDCVIYEGSIDTKSDQQGVPKTIPVKLWYSKKLGYPIKSESDIGAPMGKVSSYIENIKTGSQPDSLFEVPSGYTRAQTTQEAMGLGSMGLPSGNSPRQAPTQDQMNDVMNRMKDMMKGRQGN